MEQEQCVPRFLWQRVCIKKFVPHILEMYENKTSSAFNPFYTNEITFTNISSVIFLN
jgi:hypothetical protein